MLKLRSLIFILFIPFFNLFSIEVVVNKKKIDYHNFIEANNLEIKNVTSVKKYCVPMKFNEFINKKMISTRYLREGTILCTKDVEEYQKNSVLFNFGTIEVERPGKVIFENDEYIKIRSIDGKIEKIYKDGRVQ